MADHQLWVSNKGNNSNSGSASNPLKTIQAALNKASNGTDVMVKAGTYTENLKLYDNNISLISADGNQEATIRAANQHASTISGFGLENVTIRGFVIDGANNSNALHFGMSKYGFKDPIRNLTIEDNKIHSSGGDGIKISQALNVKILDNDILNSGSEAIDFVAVNGSRVADNVVKGADGTAGIMVKGGSRDVDIINNKVSDTDVNGISVGGWTSAKWMWPNARGYEAKDMTVTGNEVWDVNKSAILVSGARDSHISNNYLHPDNDYDAVIWIDRSISDHSSPLYSGNITLSGNVLDSDDWLRVNNGNKHGLKVSGNEVGPQKSGATKGAWGSAADQKSDAGDGGRAGLVDGTGSESIVYDHLREAGTPADGASRSDASGADDQPHFRLPSDAAGTANSAALTKWQALEDASAPVDASVAADQSRAHDPSSDADKGWLL